MNWEDVRELGTPGVEGGQPVTFGLLSMKKCCDRQVAEGQSANTRIELKYDRPDGEMMRQVGTSSGGSV